ncbi:hypothetical protein ERO13_D09G241900v2 [Gossypium hirsutum]|uniref:Uncharacterized protein LOC107931388 n=5 Tax=Gossypium TaxID=3633 RepID=A0A1U8LW00_GOSHI|nr:uncharacterized protein LOC107931388 [Gossypium hirsutum]XP_016718757.1 uncharacterized protein LOC107931388 [Gossypium hirsutum]KAB2014942.1 hypothetical protein ES319_D09G262800v1 [Gossypium barbadense]TYG55527.1 hypothetical protein ES288_D09G280700v1 [Gossypium darwinii]TYH56046.1 hypothetical protein ES332_D09G280800v1 [Gossypium tomentosum]TYI67053.1 hypothetical protein E1A91_D09G271300v1 [Gossypium mustelinum]KAB2014943.1 hypothetical protein ES319_D09G262800v1 [Gossypium barbadens
MAPRDKDLELGIENGVIVNARGEKEDYSISPISDISRPVVKVKGGLADDRVSLSGDVSSCGSVCVENPNGDGKDAKENRLAKEKRKSLGYKKPPKPPRPPRAPSLDAADQKLIKEIAELARLKRARLKALKKMKATKGMGTTSSNSTNNMLAAVFTVIFCIVMIFQGMSSGNRPTSFQGSPVLAGARTVKGGLISVQFSGKQSANIPNQPDSGSPYLVEQVAGLDPWEKPKRSSG